MIEELLTAQLLADTDITDEIGDRLYPVSIPEKTEYPCISYQTISNTDATTLNKDEPTLNFKRIQINIWAKNYSDCKTLEGLIKSSIYNGTLKAGVENIRDTPADKLKIFGTSLDIIANNK